MLFRSRKAQDAAESHRKEAESAREELDAAKSELEDLKSKARKSEEDKKRISRLEAGIEDDEALVEQMENQAKKGDRDMRAHLAAMDKRATKAAEAVFEKKMAESNLKSQFLSRDEWVEAKAKEHKMDLKKFTDEIGDFAYPELKSQPVEQARNAYKYWLREQDLKRREMEVETFKRSNSNFRDGGTDSIEPAKDGKVDFSKGDNWKLAKTKAEKMAALADI